ncbi:hypothetical protein DSO57_1035306 [Entomophthora muscae]|uniref:Uncharacterized protein n=1 Tax=Entomophthora muscae TaxID=34485 RepID=A0ACC2UJG0_9FUNG|nr:hypothetical protein DSO57_1035306 [Entomophthora muscae]
MEVVTKNKTVQDLKAQREEARKAASKACFAASKTSNNIPASPSQKAAPVATSPHNSLSFFKPANLPRFNRKIKVAMFL